MDSYKTAYALNVKQCGSYVADWSLRSEQPEYGDPRLRVGERVLPYGQMADIIVTDRIPLFYDKTAKHFLTPEHMNWYGYQGFEF